MVNQNDNIQRAINEAQYGDSTRSVHGGAQRKKAHHAVTTPIVLSSTFTYDSTGDLVDFMNRRFGGGNNGDRTEYTRFGNPTVASAEARIAALEHADDAILYGSGMAAITSLLLTVLRAGQHVVMTDAGYVGTRQFLEEVLSRFGVESTFVPIDDYDALENAVIKGKTRLIISESPTNPYLRVADLERIVSIAKANRALTMIDATFATPINLRPLDYGIDFVVHSATKYLGGHNDILAGCIAGRGDRIQALKERRVLLGNGLDPHSAFLLERGLKTLTLRVRHQNATAQAVAEYLAQHPKVSRVYYPGLTDHPDHELATRQMNGFGGVVSFEIEGDLQVTGDFVDRCCIPLIGPSLGGTESLIEQPALVNYFELSTAERHAIGISDSLVRYAVGLEDAEDLIADLEQALAGIPEREVVTAWEQRFRS